MLVIQDTPCCLHHCRSIEIDPSVNKGEVRRYSLVLWVVRTASLVFLLRNYEDLTSIPSLVHREVSTSMGLYGGSVHKPIHRVCILPFLFSPILYHMLWWYINSTQLLCLLLLPSVSMLTSWPLLHLLHPITHSNGIRYVEG